MSAANAPDAEQRSAAPAAMPSRRWTIGFMKDPLWKNRSEFCQAGPSASPRDAHPEPITPPLGATSITVLRSFRDAENGSQSKHLATGPGRKWLSADSGIG